MYAGLISVKFTAQRGRSYKSDIALDDVTFSPGCGSINVCQHPTITPIFGTSSGIARYLPNVYLQNLWDQGIRVYTYVHLHVSGIHLSVRQGKVTAGVSRNETLNGNLTFPYNMWAHVALQYDGHKRQQVLYVNGQKDKVMDGVPSPDNRLSLLLGQNGQSYLKGQADEIRLWAGSVNVSQIYNKYQDSAKPNLYRYFRCNTGEGQELKDTSKKNSPATLKGPGWLSSFLKLMDQ